MRSLPRQAKLAAKPIIDDDLSDDSDFGAKEIVPKRKPLTGDFFKDTQIKIKEESRDESPVSDYEHEGRKRKSLSTARQPPAKKSKLVIRKSGRASPEVPAMSEDEYEDDREDDVRLFEKVQKPLQRGNVPGGVKITTLPNVIQIQVLTAPTTINLNIGDLLAPHLKQQATASDLDGSTLLDDAEPVHEARAQTPTSFAEMRANPEYACFLELAPELRNRIYRDLLVKDIPVAFNPSKELSRTAALLRSCRQVYHEGTDILYGENAFHLDRTDRRRGSLYTTWREIGFKDMRRFVETIGQDNLSKMRFLSINLTDAAPVDTPDHTSEQRRYQNDPVLCHIFKLIGQSNAVFEKLVVNFGGRSALESDSIPFVRAFSTMRCRKLIKTCHWQHSRIGVRLFSELKEFMQVPGVADIDPDKQKAPKMHHEMTERQYGCHSYNCSNRSR